LTTFGALVQLNTHATVDAVKFMPRQPWASVDGFQAVKEFIKTEIKILFVYRWREPFYVVTSGPQRENIDKYTVNSKYKC
jgi:hypothetical protein